MFDISVSKPICLLLLIFLVVLLFVGCWFVLGLFFSFPEIHLIYHALKCAAEITVQFQEKLCREQAKIAHYLYHTELDNNLLFLTLRGAN